MAVSGGGDLGYEPGTEPLALALAAKDAMLGRVREVTAHLERLQAKSAEDEEAGYRGSNVYSDAYRYAVDQLHAALVV